MGGGASRDPSPGMDMYLDPNSQINTADLAKNLKEFAATDAGSKYANVIKSNGGRPIYSNTNGGWAVSDGSGGYTSTDFIPAYQKWLAGQNQTEDQRKQYLDLVAQQQGRDQTILTGPASNTLLTR